MIDKNMLRRYRELNDYSYSMLAKILDVSKREIRDWEVGDSVPDDEQLSILAKLYNISVDDFYFTLKADFVFDVKSIVLLVIALIVGVITGIMLSNIGIILLAPFLYVIMIYFFLKINNSKKSAQTIQDGVDSEIKSLFGKRILYLKKKDRFKLYIYESIVVACFAIFVCLTVNSIAPTPIMLTVELFDIESVNAIVVYGFSCLLLFVISFIIELVFSEYMLKKYKGIIKEV